MATTQSTLTMREIAQVERLCGLSMNQVGDEDTPVAEYMAAVATVVRQRTDPEFTYDQALDMTLAELNALNASESDPKEPGTPTTG